MRSFRLLIAVLTLSLFAVLFVAGCGKSGSSSASQSGSKAEKSASSSANSNVKIGFLVKMPEESWFQNEWMFAQQCADKNGFKLIKIGAKDGEKVLSAIDNLAAQGAQGFVICTPDVRLGPAIVAKAKSNNLKVYSVDDQFVGADGKFMDVPYMGIAAHDIGGQVGQALYDEMKKRGWKVDETGVCAVTYDQLNTSKERTDGAIEALISAGFPKNRIYKVPEKTTDVPGARDAADVLITKHPEVKRWLVCSLNDEGVMGAVRAMEGRGFDRNTIIGVGIGGSTCLEEFKREKETGFFATCLISPRRHGYETTEYLFKWVKDGKEPPKVIKTLGYIVTRENYKQVMKEQGLAE